MWNGQDRAYTRAGYPARGRRDGRMRLWEKPPAGPRAHRQMLKPQLGRSWSPHATRTIRQTSGVTGGSQPRGRTAAIATRL